MKIGPTLDLVFTREPWLRAGLTIEILLLLQKKHLSQFTLENVPKHKFTLEMVPKYKFTHENPSNVNKQPIVNKQLKVNKLPI